MQYNVPQMMMLAASWISAAVKAHLVGKVISKDGRTHIQYKVLQMAVLTSWSRRELVSVPGMYSNKQRRNNLHTIQGADDSAGRLLDLDGS